MNDSNKSSNGLLVLRYPCDLSQETANRLTEFLTPTAEALGVEPLVLGNGADVRLEYGSSALLERVCVALEKIAAQGEPPVIETQEGPSERPTLNARPGTLNSREVEAVDQARLHGALGKTIDALYKAASRG